MNNWEMAEKCKQFAPLNSSNTPPPIELPVEIPNRSAYAETHNLLNSRPWTRYFAKIFDLNIFILILALIIPSHYYHEVPAIVIGVVCVFLWVFIEPIILVLFGNTLGRYLLKTKIIMENGNNVDYSTALKRSLFLWIRGLGMGIPFVNLICLIVSYKDLKRDGITHWDRDNNLQITHKKISFVRLIIVMLLPISFSFYSVIANEDMGQVGSEKDIEINPTFDYVTNVDLRNSVVIDDSSSIEVAETIVKQEKVSPDANEQIKEFADDTEKVFNQFFSSFNKFETSIKQNNYEEAIKRMGEFNTSVRILENKLGFHHLSGQYDIALQGIKVDLNKIKRSIEIDFATFLPISANNDYARGRIKSNLSLLKSNIDIIDTSYRDILSEISN